MGYKGRASWILDFECFFHSIKKAFIDKYRIEVVGIVKQLSGNRGFGPIIINIIFLDQVGENNMIAEQLGTCP